jgi:hypothetical protein
MIRTAIGRGRHRRWDYDGGWTVRFTHRRGAVCLLVLLAPDGKARAFLRDIDDADAIVLRHEARGGA